MSDGQFFWGGILLKCNGGVYKGWLRPDGNRSGRAKAQASLTARLISRADAKAELSEPMRLYRWRKDQQIKATLGITG